MKILVTGGAGFIGSHVAKELISHNHDVIILDDLSGGFIENIPEKAIFIKGSITDVDLIDRIFTVHKFDYVYHLAAYAAEGLSFFIKRFNYDNNLIGSVNLINASVSHDIKCFVFTSSIAVYGDLTPPFNENMIPHPEDPYGISKYAVEMDLQISKKIWDLNYIIFRPHNVYGEQQNIGDKYRNVIGIFMNQILSGHPLTIFGDGKQTRAFSYIKDIAPIIAQSAMHPPAYNQIFNIGADQFYSINDIAQLILKTMKTDTPLKYLPPRLETINAHSTHEKLEKIFGISKKTSLFDGLNQMVAWVKTSGPKKNKNFNNIEINKNLPSAWKTYE
jgi:UDP-glucose 4-epimerase